MKNIFFLIQNFGRPAGSERATALVANSLITKGYRVSIVSVCGDNKSFYDINSKINLYTLLDKEKVDNRKNFISVCRSFDKFLKNHEVDVCIDVFASLSIYSLILKQKYRYKNITWEHFNYKVNTGMNKIGRQLAVRYSDKIVTLTQTDMNFYCESNKLIAGITYIYNPSPFQESKLHNFNNKQVISVGRLTHQKGFDRLIKIWEIVEKQTDWSLKIYGEGEDYHKLYHDIKIRNLQRVYLMGATNDIQDAYLNSSVYVSTSRYEGLPMTMIEAQSFGLPIVSFDFDTGASEVISDGVDGYLIERQGEDRMIRDMAGKLFFLLSHQEIIERMSKEALRRSSRFKTDAIVKKWSDLLEEL